MTRKKPEKIRASHRRDAAWVRRLRPNLRGVAGNRRGKPQSISCARNPKQKSPSIGGIHGNIYFPFQQEKDAGRLIRLTDENGQARTAKICHERLEVALRFG